jgi:hypothetical protein
MLEEHEVDINEIKTILFNRKIDFIEGVAYIMPESSNEDIDLINEYSPDLRKDLMASGIQSVVVRGDKHNYLALRSADIILPLIFGIPFAVFANFITGWIKDNLDENKKVRVKYIKETKGKYTEIMIEGSGDEINEILDRLKEH